MTSIRTLAAFAVCLALPVLGAGQGLGAAAAKEKERRASSQKTAQPAKTYTEDSLKGLPPAENPGASSSSGAGTSTSEDAKGTSSSSGETDGASATPEQSSEERDRAQAEAHWRGRIAAARARVEKAREKASFYESLNLVPGAQYVDENGAVVIGSVQQLQGLTRRAKAELAVAEKALEDLQEEARRASVPPGWLR